MSVQTALDEYSKFQKELTQISEKISNFCRIVSVIVTGRFFESTAPEGYKDCITVDGYSLVLDRECYFTKKERESKTVQDSYGLTADDYISILKLLPDFWGELDGLFKDNLNSYITKVEEKIKLFSFVNAFD